MHMQGTRSLFRALKSALHKVYLPALLINCTTLPHSSKMPMLSGSPNTLSEHENIQNMYMYITTCKLIASLTEYIT